MTRKSCLFILFLITLVINLSSCGMIMSRYSPYPQNSLLLKDVGEDTKTKVSVAEFTADYDAKSPKSCRMVGAINMPEKEKPYEVVRKALIDELSLANLYSKDSSKVINAHVKNISFSTVSSPKWIIEGTFDLEGTKVPVSIEHKFEGGFVAVTACNNAVNAFMPSVQDYLYTFFKTDEFRNFVRKSEAQ